MIVETKLGRDCFVSARVILHARESRQIHIAISTRGRSNSRNRYRNGNHKPDASLPEPDILITFYKRNSRHVKYVYRRTSPRRSIKKKKYIEQQFNAKEKFLRRNERLERCFFICGGRAPARQRRARLPTVNYSFQNEEKPRFITADAPPDTDNNSVSLRPRPALALGVPSFVSLLDLNLFGNHLN
ncbi:hypothetical protein EVAR_16538_1 [Eumeta japonica]|uniref:Uncharacterized protein n=1 Tax=Eumeta variegata TaxID=151549 RepID=A0A4C1U2T0_EUMVA|nr:hypothetical protein EVAR_16538_1 [Eumeta japonica]